LEPHNRLGEGPLYDHRNGIFAWVDIRGYAVHWVNYLKGSPQEIWATHKWVSTGTPIGVLGLTKTPLKYVAASQIGFAIIDLTQTVGQGEAVEVKILQPIHSSRPDLRFNDGVVDPQGKFIAGSMPNFGASHSPRGKLYRYSANGDVEVIVDDAGTPNGIGFSPNLKYLYWADSPTSTVFRFDYDAITGQISNRQPWLKPQLEGVEPIRPDGLAISEDGDVWIAFWGGKSVRRYSDGGDVKEIYEFPAARCACPTFAGKDLDELVVVSASLRLDDEDFKHIEGEKDRGGEIFRVKIPGVRGVPRDVFSLH
jgi:sugar lactone lactonase YvrE